MSDYFVVGLYIVAVCKLIHAIYTSSRRLVSFGYAVLGGALVIVLGFAAMFIFVRESATLLETNSKLQMIGAAITIGSPLAALWGANQPPRRDKA